MDLANTKQLYREHVAHFLKYRLGSKLSNRITNHVLSLDLCNTGDSREAFKELLTATVQFAVDDRYEVLPLVFDMEELLKFENNFLSIYDDAQKEDGVDSFDDIFDSLLAKELGDILGQELVDTVRKVFMKAVLAIPEQTINTRFFTGMHAVYTFIPDVWSELEFSEKVKSLSELLPKEVAEEASAESEEGLYEKLVEQIVVADLADIMGQGIVLQTVLKNAQTKTSGVFVGDLERFTVFCSHILEDDMVTQLFDTFWVDERRSVWKKEAELMCRYGS